MQEAPLRDEVPRSNEYKDKEIKFQEYTTIKGTRYFKRVFLMTV